jgi:hypothetical protein
MAWRQGTQVQRLDLDIGERTSRGAIVGHALRTRTSLPQRQREPEPSTRPEPPETWCAEVFDIIEWRRFESVVEALFAQAGFETRSQPCGANGGIDIWLHSKNRGGAAVSIVQCKHWSAWKVGVKPVRELRGVMAAHGIARGQFVTTSRYTADARSVSTTIRPCRTTRRLSMALFAPNSTSSASAFDDMPCSSGVDVCQSAVGHDVGAAAASSAIQQTRQLRKRSPDRQ